MSNTGRIIKSKLNKQFTQIPNETAQSKRLSLRAKGLLLLILSYPDDWVLYKSYLYKSCCEGRATIDTAFKELLKNGYIVKRQSRVKGKFSVDYEVIASPPLQDYRQRLNRSGETVSGKSAAENRTTNKETLDKDTVQKNKNYVDKETVTKENPQFSFLFCSVESVLEQTNRGLRVPIKDIHPDIIDDLFSNGLAENNDDILQLDF